MAMPRSFGSSQVTLRSPIQISPCVDFDQAGDGIEQGGLAAAGRAQQHQELGLRQPRDPADRSTCTRTVGDLDAAERDIAALAIL